ncbi:MAG: hypothetical protein Tsb002_26650 [Wenzhouxiangellaceae bacterium]
MDIQNDRISEITTRIVAPAGKLSDFKNEAMKKLTPVIEHEGKEYLLLIPQLSSFPSNLLKQPIGTI